MHWRRRKALRSLVIPPLKMAESSTHLRVRNPNQFIHLEALPDPGVNRMLAYLCVPLIGSEPKSLNKVCDIYHWTTLPARVVPTVQPRVDPAC